MKYSIIVIAYNIENFIEECLDSCVFPNRDDYEVIVVYNASTDRTLESIKRVTSRHPGLFTIIENDENVGLGEGRNQGMRESTGDYFIFLDGDDFLSPEALQRISQVVESKTPEILMINFQRFHQDGRLEDNKATRLLAEGWRKTPQSRAEMLKNFGVAWNKVYSRDFVEKHNLLFPIGYYEDIVWNAECLMRATSIYTIPDNLIFYRQRPGSILRSTDARHFDTITRHRDIIRILRSEPELAKDFVKPLRDYSRHQMFATLHLGGRIPKGREGEFLKAASDTIDMYNELAGIKRKTIREKVAATGSYPLYRIYRYVELREKPGTNPISKAFTAWKSTKLGKKADKQWHQSMKWWYRKVFLKLPIKHNRVIFDSFWGARPDGNPLALYKALSTRSDFDCAYMLRRVAPGIKGSKIDRVGRSSFRGYYYLATSKYLVTNSAFPDDYVKRPGQVFIQTQHGTPFKYMGLQQRKVQPKAMNWWHLALRTRIWDYVISANQYSTAVWRKAYPYNYKVIETGYPANDIFAKLTHEEIDEIKIRAGIPNHMKTVLYAPTHRDGKQIQIGQLINTDRLLEALGDDYVLLVRTHYFTKPSASNGKRVFDLSHHPVTNEVLAISDMLITDYSSIMVDYGVLNRPIILYTFDSEEYQTNRGTYIDLAAVAPGMVAQTFDELAEGIESRRFETPENMERLNNFRKQFCSLDDGQATKRVLEEVFGIRDDDPPRL